MKEEGWNKFLFLIFYILR